MAAGALIDAADSILTVVDIQERLLPHIEGGGTVAKRAAILIRAARILDIPILLTEQHPRGLGPTVPEIARLAEGIARIEKTSFGCFGEKAFAEAMAVAGRRTLVLCGIETHVCVLQTALVAASAGTRAVVAADACGSRSGENRVLALDRMARAGVTVTPVESILLEWLRDAKHPRFGEVQALIK